MEPRPRLGRRRRAAVVDQRARLRALRALAAPGSGATEPERKLAKEKADELERKINSASTNDTTTIGRDGFWRRDTPGYDAWVDSVQRARQERASKIAEDLLHNQWRWNSEYYDQNGNPKEPPKEDEDYGYEAFNEKSEYYDDK